MRIAMIQMPVGKNKLSNIAYAVSKIREAAKQTIDLAILPEMFCCPYANDCFRTYCEEVGGEAQMAMSSLAKELEIYIIAGSVPELCGDKLYNTSYVYGRNGRQIGKHRKMHLFDVDIPGGQRFCESDTLTRGDEITTFDTEFGKMGLCICFDFRFQELARRMTLRGAKILFVPGAFNMTTGPAHWEIMFRQRAVDNQVFTVGAAPARDVNAHYVSWGHSIAVHPWGNVLEHFGAEADMRVIDIDLEDVERIRRQLPIITARRTDKYNVVEY
ncbi:MAG: carbon-nitrogen hydrolase family protein [Oscillospiraceae bacterium]